MNLCIIIVKQPVSRFPEIRIFTVSRVTRLWARQSGFDSWQRQGFFSLPPGPYQLRGTPSLLSIEYWRLFLWG